MQIEQGAGFLMDAARAAAGGRLAPAAFQRPYAWSQSDVEAFFVSIQERWPLGSILTWSPARDVDMSGLTVGRLGPKQVEPSDHPSIILDGQNRLATFAWAASQKSAVELDATGFTQMENETWLSGKTLVADFPAREIHFVDRGRLDDPNVLPIGLMCGDNAAMNAAFRRGYDKGMTDDAVTWFDRIQDNVRSARITTTNLRDATVAEAKRAFLHISRAGVPMSAEDFENAMSWAEPAAGARP